MSRSIRGDKRAKKLSGRLAHDQKLTRYNKRNSVLTYPVDNYQHTVKGNVLC